MEDGGVNWGWCKPTADKDAEITYTVNVDSANSEGRPNRENFDIMLIGTNGKTDYV
jgi:hypothetical protein